MPKLRSMYLSPVCCKYALLHALCEIDLAIPNGQAPIVYTLPWAFDAAINAGLDKKVLEELQVDPEGKHLKIYIWPTASSSITFRNAIRICLDSIDRKHLREFVFRL